MSFSRLVIFGEVLFDCFPDGARVLGGAPFNVAWHCHAFGLQPLFISRVGNDPLGQEVISAMHNWGLDSSGLQLDSSHATGVVDVSFKEGEPAYEIIENSAWDFIDHQTTPVIDEHCVLYHGSLALRNSVSASSLADVKQQCSSSIFIDVNLRPPWWDLSIIQYIIQSGQWIKLNSEELALIVPQLADIESRMQFLLANTNVKLVVVTRGGDGAIAATQNERCSVHPDTIDHVVDTVGAGDAFTSVLLLGLYKDWSLQTILNRAQQFASAVVQQRGATTQDKTFYKHFINAWQL